MDGAAFSDMGYGWTSTGEQPSVMSEAVRPRVRRWRVWMVDAESSAILRGFLPGPRARRRGSLCFDSRFRIVPSARWQRSAASRTVYQRSTSLNTGSIMPNTTPVPEAEVNERGDLGRATHAMLANSFKEFAEGGSSVHTSNSAITAPRLLSSSRGADSGRRRDPAAVPRIRRRRNVRLQSRPSADVLCPSYCESRR